MDCPSIPNGDYGAFSKRLHQAIHAKHLPIGGGIDLTSRCNLNCVHCYINEPATDEFSLGEITRLFDEIAEAGCLWMLLTGGEPLLRKDFPEIYLYAKKKGFLITLFTNATLLTPELADMLAKWPPFAVEISLYGATRETYEKVTGVKGSFDRCLEGIRLLRERGISLRLKSMVLSINHHELNAMMEFAREQGTEFRYDANIHGRLDLNGCTTDYRLPPEDIVALDMLDKRRISSLREFVEYSKKQKMDHENLFHCGAGLDSFHVGSDGKMYLCIMVRDLYYDLRKGTFAEAWNEFIPRVRGEKAREDYKCSRCELFFLCGQCPGWGALEAADRHKKSEFLCKLAHLREDAFSKEALWKEPKDDKKGIAK